MLQTLQYSLSDIKDEVQTLLGKGAVSRLQPIYTLCQHFSYREWHQVEQLLERHDYLLRDQIGDLVPFECWSND
ncbi:MAG: DUF4327 family protein [Leptolyngbyaceae bacterium]|nr:DUF4327 family protein [Leptolyngbyaceae bacterium]